MKLLCCKTCWEIKIKSLLKSNCGRGEFCWYVHSTTVEEIGPSKDSKEWWTFAECNPLSFTWMNINTLTTQHQASNWFDKKKYFVDFYMFLLTIFIIFIDSHFFNFSFVFFFFDYLLYFLPNSTFISITTSSRHLLARTKLSPSESPSRNCPSSLPKKY